MQKWGRKTQKNSNWRTVKVWQSIWWCLWVLHSRLSLTAPDFHPSTKNSPYICSLCWLHSEVVNTFYWQAKDCWFSFRWRHKSPLGLHQEGHPVWKPLVTAENSTHQKESWNLKWCPFVQLLLNLWKCGTKKNLKHCNSYKMSVISKQLFQYFFKPPKIKLINCICVNSWLFGVKSTVSTQNFSSENMMQSIYLKTQILCCFLFINVNSFYLKKQTNRFHTPFSMTMTRSLLISQWRQALV